MMSIYKHIKFGFKPKQRAGHYRPKIKSLGGKQTVPAHLRLTPKVLTLAATSLNPSFRFYTTKTRGYHKYTTSTTTAAAPDDNPLGYSNTNGSINHILLLHGELNVVTSTEDHTPNARCITDEEDPCF